MRTTIFKLVLAIGLAGACAGGACAHAREVAAPASDAGASASDRGSPAVAALIARYADAVGALHLAPLALSYETNIAALMRETDIPAQQKLFADLAARLQSLDRRGANACQQVDLGRMAFEIDTNLRKLALLGRFAALGERAVAGSEGLHAMPMGAAWYRYFLTRWLGADVTPAQLTAFGERELATVLARYHRLQAQMGYAGRDDAFRAYLDGAAFSYPDGQTPQRDYEARQATVYRHLDSLFLPTGITPALVREATLGARFPADGYYEPGSRTFYYNKATPSYGRRPLDMLTLHESTPGHHYQNHYAEARGACPTTLPPVFYAAFSEGWGAYVEEFGTQLGLYQTPADELGAVEWDLVRSIRVVLDVGINADGWSRERALGLLA